MSRRRRTVDEREADRAVLAALRARGGTVTRADVVVATGLPEQVVERSLARLLDRYTSAVAVAPGGVLLYRFASGFKRRAERRPWLRALLRGTARMLAAAARTARAVFRAVLAVQLLVYVFIVLIPVSVVVGTVVGIAVLLMGLFSDGGGDLAAAMADPHVAAVVLGIFVIGGIGWTMKKKWQLLMELVGARELDVGARGVGGLVARVNALAVGPPKRRRRGEATDATTAISPADERRLLARVREAGGRLRAAELVRWLGFSLDRADAQLTRLLVEYGGEPVPVEGEDVDDADKVAVLEVRFESLLQTADRDGDAGEQRRKAEEPTAFERAEPPPRFSGNPPRADGFVVLFAVVNLVAGLIGWRFLGERRGEGALWWLAWAAGAALPVGFSLLLISLPLLRAPIWGWRKARRLAELARGAMVRAVVEHVGERGAEAVDVDALAAGAKRGQGVPMLSGAEARQVALELGGELQGGEGSESGEGSGEGSGRVKWRFRRLAAEIGGRAATTATTTSPSPTTTTTTTTSTEAKAKRKRG